MSSGAYNQTIVSLCLCLCKTGSRQGEGVGKCCLRFGQVGMCNAIGPLFTFMQISPIEVKF